MREHDIRHLPVMDNGALCGIVSERDLFLVERFPDTDPTTTRVEEAMTENPFLVTSDTPIDEIAEIMGEHKYGSVVVMGRHGVEGIFTSTDVCQAFARTLREVQLEDILAART
jgi:acetoin utilization protein AcuB